MAFLNTDYNRLMLNGLSLILICAGSDLRGLAYKTSYFSLFDLETIYFLMQKRTRCVKNSSSNEICWLLKREAILRWKRTIS